MRCGAEDHGGEEGKEGSHRLCEDRGGPLGFSGVGE